MEQQRFDLTSQKQEEKTSGPVTCLGLTFEDDGTRRAHFTEELRKKLQDPEFRRIEGFPIGSDEDILNLSDPPYYTACPNPWIADFIAEWETQKPEQPEPEGYHYHREPFAADVSEGKNDPIYNAHSYHTKVPHKAIMRYILHYTEPGDIVFDGFCGTGMTGVAAQMCGDRETVMSLGYQVKPDGTILQEEIDEVGKKVWRPFSRIGVRRAVINDLSPAATFISNNYNTPIDIHAFESDAYRSLKNVEKKCGWMFQTLHEPTASQLDLAHKEIANGDRPYLKPSGKVGKINYTLWSDVLVCPECANEFTFWDEAVDKDTFSVKDRFNCPNCASVLSKNTVERALVTDHDDLLGEAVAQVKQRPVLISYVISGKKLTKLPDEIDFAILTKIKNMKFTVWQPNRAMMFKGERWGDSWRAGVHTGITHVHHFYVKRNLVGLSVFRQSQAHLSYAANLTSTAIVASKLYRFRSQGGSLGAGGGPMSGTLYLPSLIKEIPVTKLIKEHIKKTAAIKRSNKYTPATVVATGSMSNSSIPSASVDYLFFDPPFGANIMYSELNFIWESWLNVFTNIQKEAIENNSQNKSLDDYRKLMIECFKEAHRVLKPGRWMTVEFSNTKASVWNSIQAALTESGFIVANVSALDKKQGSFKAVTTPTAVKQDLVISAYKPNGGFEERFQKEAQTEEGVWDFVRTHLKYLPVTKRQGALMLFVPERDPRILFDQMIAFYVRKGYPVPISSQEFQVGLSQRFVERDGMCFLPGQAAEYDRKKMTSGAPQQLSMFVSDEASAIQWIRHLIKEKPQTFSDINPQFMQQLGGWSKNEAQLDLRELLNQSFLCYDGKGPVPEQIHAYLSTNWKELRNLPKDDPTLVAKARDRWYVPDPNKAGDLEKLREKALLKEFEEYKQAKKKLKVFRLEAVRAGFKKAWQDHDYPTIVAVADKIPNNVLEEDPKLLMWYDQAVTRMGGE